MSIEMRDHSADEASEDIDACSESAGLISGSDVSSGASTLDNKACPTVIASLSIIIFLLFLYQNRIDKTDDYAPSGWKMAKNTRSSSSSLSAKSAPLHLFKSQSDERPFAHQSNERRKISFRPKIDRASNSSRIRHFGAPTDKNDILPSVTIIVSTVPQRHFLRHHILRNFERTQYAGEVCLLLIGGND